MADYNNLFKISRAIGNRYDYFQGGGGNVSVKPDDCSMIIKASGCRVSEMDENKGIVKVDFKKIADFVSSADNFNYEPDKYFEGAILDCFNDESVRPSIETALHSILGRFIIHSHSVYANILNCSYEGHDILKRIFKDEDFCMVRYEQPGIKLARLIKEKFNNHKAKYGRSAKYIFLDNHGLIVSADNFDEALETHEKVNEAIKNYLKVDMNYPEPRIQKTTDGFISDTQYIQDFFQSDFGKDLKGLDYVLFPDQIVYLEDLAFSLDCQSGQIIYQIESERRSCFMEETLLSWCFVIDFILKSELNIRSISDNDASVIKEMPSEKFRKKFIK